MTNSNHIALSVQHARKVFRKNGNSGRWRRLRSKKNDSGDKPPRQVIAVNDVSFEIQSGEIFGILGPNGSGKSTLVRLVATLLQPDGGTVTVFGHDVQR